MLLPNGTAILLQNAAEVYYKMCQFFIKKCDSFITKCNSYYKLRQLYYKMRRLLQIATVQGNTRKYLLITVANVINELKKILNSKFGKLNS